MKMLNSDSRVPMATVSAIMLSVCVAGCGGGTDTAEKASSGSVAGSVDLSGVSVSVGSKEFTEQKILGQIMVQTLEAAGAKVKDQTGLTGTPVVRKALTSGSIDMYYEYTGTGWINILGNAKPVSGEEQQMAAVTKADAKNNVTWLDAAPANNTYAIAANKQIEAKYSPATISDYATIAKDHPDEAGLCTAAEFVTRDDGLPGLSKAYGFELPKSQVATLDFGLVYASVAKGKPCNFAVVFATDGQILANGLTVLEDDKKYFPAYNIAVSMRTKTYQAHKAEYDDLFGKLDPLLTTEAMTKLNAAVDVEGQDVATVAEKFLKDNKVI